MKGALERTEESTAEKEAPSEQPTVTIGTKEKRTKVPLKGELPAEPEHLRMVKNDLKSSRVRYIRERVQVLDSQCVADAIGRTLYQTH